MIEWLFIIAGWMLLLGGVWIAFWWGWRDTGKRTRRCPKCWYDMSATAGLKCPECGLEAKAEPQLFRTHRKWRWVFVGFVIVAVSYPIFKWPLYQRASWVGFVPRCATIWLIPDLPDAWTGWKAGSPARYITLIDEICRARPLDRPERLALAKMYCRVLGDPKRYVREFQLLWLWQHHLGDQAPVVGPQLAESLFRLDKPQALLQLAERFPPVSDSRMAGVVGPLVRVVVEGKARSHQADELLDRLKLWGASDEDLRAVAFYSIEHREAGRYPDSREVEFLWRENLIRPEDAERVGAWALVQVWAFATYTTFLACEVPEALPRLLPALDETMKIDSLQQIPDWTCLAVAMRGDGAPMRPAFERMSRLTRYPSHAACSSISLMAIDNRPLEAYRLWWEYLQNAKNTDAHKFVQRYQLAPAVLYLDVPVATKVEGLIEVLRLEQDDAGGGVGLNQCTTIALDSLGKLGPAAHIAIGQLCSLIEPGAPYYLIERVLRTIGKIGPLAPSEFQALQRSMDEWSRSTASVGSALIYFENITTKNRDDGLKK